MIWQRRQLIVWWLLSAAAVAGVTAWLALRWHVRTQHESAAHGASLKKAHEWIHSQLTLTKEQDGRLATLAAVAEKEQGESRGRVLAAEKEVAEALRAASDENAPALQAALQKLADERAALQRAVIKHYLAVCGVLDAAQRKAFMDWNSAQFDPP